MAGQAHRSDPRILGRRTLGRDHRCLAQQLRPGLSVLDVGCGTGAITADVAAAVGLGGRVLGIDRDETLLQTAAGKHGTIPNLRFVRCDATSLEIRSEFDIVTAARTLQWIAQPALAIRRMTAAVKPGGMLVVLDYNHSRNAWQPHPPDEFTRFYDAFLAWRAANGWDNDMADHLPELFRSAGLTDIGSEAQDEVVERGEPDFEERTALWSEVIETVGPRMAEAGFTTETQLETARDSYKEWVGTRLVAQALAMRCITGVVP